MPAETPSFVRSGKVRDLYRVDEDRLTMARNLPGARYLVNTTFVREQWLKVGAELQRLFPEERPA